MWDFCMPSCLGGKSGHLGGQISPLPMSRSGPDASSYDTTSSRRLDLVWMHRVVGIELYIRLWACRSPFPATISCTQFPKHYYDTSRRALSFLSVLQPQQLMTAAA